MSETFHPSGIPSYFRYAIFGIIMSGLIEVSIPYLPSNIRIYHDQVILIIWILVILRSVIAWIANRFKSIELSDRDITLKTGMLSVKKVIISFERIANVNVHQSLFQRIVRIGSITIDSLAGTHEADMDIENLTNNAIEQILQKTKGKMFSKI